MGLDGVEIVMRWEESFGILITDAEAASIRTPHEATGLICGRLAATNGIGDCLSRRAFHRLRQAFQNVLSCPRSALLPRTRIADLVPSRNRRHLWRALAADAGVESLPKYLFGWFGGVTLADLTCHLVARYPESLRGFGNPWTARQVREVVRAVVADKTGIRDFSDTADFVYDLRVD